jgi:hypothetical protein
MSDDHDDKPPLSVVPDRRPPSDWPGNDRRPGGKRPTKRWKPPKKDPRVDPDIVDSIKRALDELPVADDPRRRVHQACANLVADLIGQEDVDSRQMQRFVLATRTIAEHANQSVVDPRGAEETGDDHAEEMRRFLVNIQEEDEELALPEVGGAQE